MPTIMLPDHMRDSINDAFGNELNRQIGAGRVDAYLTCQNHGADGQTYVLEFKNVPQSKPFEFWKRIWKSDTDTASWTFRGKDNDGNSGNPIELRPSWEDQGQAAALLGMTNYSLLLFPPSPEEQGEQKVRVVLSPSGSRPVYMALEGSLSNGESVPMQRGDLYPFKENLPTEAGV